MSNTSIYVWYQHGVLMIFSPPLDRLTVALRYQTYRCLCFLINCQTSSIPTALIRINRAAISRLLLATTSVGRSHINWCLLIYESFARHA